MIRKIFVSLAAVLALWVAFAPAVSALAQPLEEVPPEDYACAAALLMEPESGQVIFEKNGDLKRPVASVTKIMTVLLALEAIDGGSLELEERVTVSPNAASMGGSQALLDAGEKQSAEALLQSVIVGSANDSAVALAEHMAGSVELFVERMNRRARELGMEDTRFINVTGLPGEGQYTTAHDVAVMARELCRHDLFFRYSGVWMYDFVHESGRVTRLSNTNKLIRLYDGCDGVKTGSTAAAGYCMAASAKRGNMRLIAVVLGSDSGRARFDAAARMLDYGFAAYRVYPVAEMGARVRGEARVTGGEKDSVPLRLGGDLTLLLKRGEEQKVTLEPEAPPILTAPVREGQTVGHVRVLMEGREVGRVPIVAAEDVGSLAFPGALGRTLHKWAMGK